MVDFIVFFHSFTCLQVRAACCLEARALRCLEARVVRCPQTGVFYTTYLETFLSSPFPLECYGGTLVSHRSPESRVAVLFGTA